MNSQHLDNNSKGEHNRFVITFKTIFLISKYQKVAEAKKLRLNTFNCSKFSKKMQITAN